jgi:hypothetical protein
MKSKVSAANRSKQVPLSLYPSQKRWASRRADRANLSFSRYVQVLIELDKAHNVLPDALTHKLKAA